MDRKKELPEFESLDEMARYFEAHSADELELEPADVRYEPKRKVLSIRFDPEDVIALNRLARRHGMDRSTFVRVIIKRFLNQVSHDEQAAAST